MGEILGKRVGHYDVQLLLGAGGMGRVYRARDSRLGRDAALKLLPPEWTGDPDRLARLEREARLLASLNHPNIATIRGIEDAPATAPSSRRHGRGGLECGSDRTHVAPSQLFLSSARHNPCFGALKEPERPDARKGA